MEIIRFKLVRHNHEFVYLCNGHSKYVLGRGKSGVCVLDPTNQFIQLKSEYVSGKHCEIVFNNDDNVWKIQDLGSCNGTFLNGVRLKKNQRREVRNGDLIGLGVSGPDDDTNVLDDRIYLFTFIEIGSKEDLEATATKQDATPSGSTTGSVQQLRSSRPSSQSPGPSRRHQEVAQKNPATTTLESSSSDDSSDGLSDKSSIKSLSLNITKSKNITKSPKLHTFSEQEVREIVEPLLLTRQGKMSYSIKKPKSEESSRSLTLTTKQCSVKLHNFLQVNAEGKGVVLIPPTSPSLSPKSSQTNEKKNTRCASSDSDQSNLSHQEYSQTFDESEDNESVKCVDDDHDDNIKEDDNINEDDDKINDDDDNGNDDDDDIANDQDGRHTPEEIDISDLQDDDKKESRDSDSDCMIIEDPKSSKIPKVEVDDDVIEEPVVAGTSRTLLNRRSRKRRTQSPSSSSSRDASPSPAPAKRVALTNNMDNENNSNQTQTQPKKQPDILYKDVDYYSRDPRLNRSLLKNVPKDNKSERKKEAAKEYLLDKDTVYKDICKWRVIWLKEQKQGKSPPKFEKESHNRPVLEVLSVLNHYNTYDTYQRVFYPLILYEIWAILRKDLQYNQKQEGFQSSVTLQECTFSRDNPLIPVTKSHSSENKNWVDVHCRCTTNIRNDSILKRELCVFTYYVNNKNRSGESVVEEHSTFAFIQNNTSDFEEIRGSVSKFIYSFHVIFYRNNTHHFDIIKEKNGVIQSIASVSTILQNYQALISLPNTPLSSKILVPQRIENHWVLNNRARYESLVSHCKGLNNTQKSVVEYATTRIMQNKEEPDIMLLYGAPGTGKTKTIASIIIQLVKSREFESASPCILLCTPSGVTLDQVIFYLNEMFCDIKESHRPEMVRIKEPGETVAKWASKYVPTAIVAKKTQTPTDALCVEVIKSAQIVCCTLNYCSNYRSKLTDCFQVVNAKDTNSHLRQFSCCIIDEAASATEMESVSPLIFNFKKLLLVGDPMLMEAKVLSKKCKENKYERSLFHRLYDYYSKQIPSPVMVLQHQYRMHEEIFKWSNHYFYGGKLAIKPIRKQEIECPLLPLLFCNYTNTEQSKNGHLSDEDQFRFILELLKAIWTQIHFLKVEYSIGVIIPHAKYKTPLLNKIKQKFPQISKLIEVDVLEMFQSREKDVVIFPCFPCEPVEFISGNKLNLVLTRAKHSLMIIGNTEYLKMVNIVFKSLVEDIEFRKLVVNIPADKVKELGFVSNCLVHVFDARSTSEIPENSRLSNR